jgi:hypothetical protein
MDELKTQKQEQNQSLQQDWNVGENFPRLEMSACPLTISPFLVWSFQALSVTGC